MGMIVPRDCDLTVVLLGKATARDTRLSASNLRIRDHSNHSNGDSHHIAHVNWFVEHSEPKEEDGYRF